MNNSIIINLNFNVFEMINISSNRIFCLIFYFTACISRDVDILKDNLKMASSGKLTFSERVFICFEAMQQAVEERDSRHMSKVMRNLIILRKEMRHNDLSHELKKVIVALQHPSPLFSNISQIYEGGDVCLDNKLKELSLQEKETPVFIPEKLQVAATLPEIEGFIGLLTAQNLFDRKNVDGSIKLLRSIIESMKSHNRRSLDILVANAYYTLSICHEVKGLPDLRAELLAAHRSACQYHSAVAQAIYTNLILRALILSNLYDQAQLFLERTTFPDSQRSSSQHARYLYYVGKLRAIQLEYSDSLAKLTLALRKAPPSLSSKIETAKAGLIERKESEKEKAKKDEEKAKEEAKRQKRLAEEARKKMTDEEKKKHDEEEKKKVEKELSEKKEKKEKEPKKIPGVVEDDKNDLSGEVIEVTTTGLGFRLSVRKLALIVELLTGDIPDRRIFIEPSEQAALAPYLALVLAVKEGSVQKFQSAISQYGATVYSPDGLLSLVRRLKHTVVRSGLRTIAATYSRIKLVDVAERLGLGSDIGDATSIVQKAIADGVIDAKIDHHEQTLVAQSGAEVYTTKLPQTQLHRRTLFCMQLHDDAVRALVYPEEKSDKDKDADVEAKRLAELEAEARAEAEEEDFDDDLMDE